MSNNTNHGKKKNGMNSRTRTFITGAVFILAILVIVLCIMSGALSFKPSAAKTTPSPSPTVTAPPSTPTPAETEPAATETPTTPATYSVTVFAGHGGSADPQGTSTVNEGDSITVNFLPDDGYAVSTVTVNGELVDPSDSYTIDSVTEDMTIDVSFDTAQQTDTPAYTAAP
jgi:flagellar basal body-associated protein FliL